MENSTGKKGVLVRFVKQTLFSLLGTGTDTLVLWLFSHYILTGYAGQYIISPIISFECANIVNFIMNEKVIFRGKTGKKTTFAEDNPNQ